MANHNRQRPWQSRGLFNEPSPTGVTGEAPVGGDEPPGSETATATATGWTAGRSQAEHMEVLVDRVQTQHGRL